MEEICQPGEPAFAKLLGELAVEMEKRGWRLATAESCTGGWIAKCITDLAGSSGWFERGYVTYSNEAKQQMLGVSPDTLMRDGAVSDSVASQMVEGARREAGVAVALSVTGVAGPGGGSDDKPVGTVWFGWALDQQPVRTEVIHFKGGRDVVRGLTVGYSLGKLLEILRS